MSGRLVVRAALITGIAGGACSLDIPAHVADITLSEHLTQRFLVAGKTGANKETTYISLVGPDAARMLEATRAAAVTEAAEGSLEVRGGLLLSAHLDPYDSTLYTIEGRGRFDVYTKRHGPEELVISGDFDVGNTETHVLGDLRTGQLVLPIRHEARMNPMLLIGRSKFDDAGECYFPAPPLIGQRERPVPCNALGVGTPFSAEYFVRIHLVELVPKQVFAIDPNTEHEVFRGSREKLDVFGCIRLEAGHDSSKLLDLRGLKYVKPLERFTRELPIAAAYDRWDIPSTCSSSSSGK
jgi:hypothetical protein